MEEIIDLRPYIELLLRRLKWIVASGLILAIVAFITISLLPKTFKATALVFVAANNDLFQFDPRILSVDPEQPLNALPELARSDRILSELSQNEALESFEQIASLREILQAESGSDRSLLRLTVSSKDPEMSAQIANLWAELFVTQINSSLGLQSGEQVAFFETQLTQAKETLQNTEANLISFQEINRSNTISNTLAVYNEEQILYLTNQQLLTRLIQDSEQLRNQISQPGSNSATISDQLVALALQSESFNVASTTPLFLQIETDSSIIGTTKNEQVEFLDRLIELLQFKLSAAESQVLTLEPEILRLQKEWQEANVTHERLLNDYLIASETYISLVRKVEEEKITTQDTNRGLRLISRAVTPEAESQNRLSIALAAGIMGLLVSTVAILVRHWWHQEEE